MREAKSPQSLGVPLEIMKQKPAPAGLLFPVSGLCERVGLEGFPYSQSEQEKESGGTTCGQPRSFGFLVGSNPG